jgi:outer membrane lipoprotein SlyB
MAQTSVVATTDLNVRAGPGPQYEVIGVIGADQQAMLEGCLEDSRWCTVTVDGTQGWAYSAYLAAETSGTRVIVAERPAEIAVPTVTYETTASTGGAISGAATGAVAGALIGGPVGAAVGGVAGAATGGAVGAVIDPPEPVRTYVRSNPTETVYLEGEVVVGAGLPETVTVREIPDYEYRYVYVNGQPVLVEPQSRRIVHVIR